MHVLDRVLYLAILEVWVRYGYATQKMKNYLLENADGFEQIDGQTYLKVTC